MSDVQRLGDWCQTFTGKMFWPIDPRPEEVCIEDIAHALSLQCRFAGHCREFYSVAEHSVRVSEAVADLLEASPTGESDRIVVLKALLHDAAEAYCVDLPRPIKRASAMGKEYMQIEDRIHAAIFQHFDLTPDLPDVIKNFDNVLLMTEMRDIMAAPPRAWPESQAFQPLAGKLEPWSSRKAETLFMLRFEMLTARR